MPSMTLTARIFTCIGLFLGVCWYLLLRDKPHLTEEAKTVLYPTRSKLCENALSGNPEAQEQLGMMFLRGEVVAQDFSQARMWLRESAKSKRPESIYQMGMLYNDGKGGAQDYDLAINYLQVAAKAGDQRAINALQANPIWQQFMWSLSRK